MWPHIKKKFKKERSRLSFSLGLVSAPPRLSYII